MIIRKAVEQSTLKELFKDDAKRHNVSEMYYIKHIINEKRYPIKLKENIKKKVNKLRVSQQCNKLK